MKDASQYKHITNAQNSLQLFPHVCCACLGASFTL